MNDKELNNKIKETNTLAELMIVAPGIFEMLVQAGYDDVLRAYDWNTDCEHFHSDLTANLGCIMVPFDDYDHISYGGDRDGPEYTVEMGQIVMKLPWFKQALADGINARLKNDAMGFLQAQGYSIEFTGKKYVNGRFVD